MIKITIDKVAGVLSNIQKIATARVVVGIPQDENNRNDGQIGNAGIGYIQEFGSTAQNIPPRPFLVPGVKAVEKECAELLAEGAKNVLNNKGINVALTKAGIKAQSSVKAIITKGEGFAPLTESTLSARKRKGFKGTKPLIRTGQLRSSITYIVKGA